MILLFSPASSAVMGQSALDSLLKVLPSKSGAERVKALGDVQWELGFSDPEKALAYGTEAMKLAEGMKDSAVVAQAANDLSITQYRLGHFQKAIDLNRRALHIRMAARDTLGVAASHNKMGAAFIELMLFDSALAHNYAAERIYEQRGDLLRTAQMRGNIARLYQQLGNIPMALKVARETVEMLKRTDSEYALANALGQLAQILTDAKNWNQAERTGLEALALFQKIGSTADIGSVSNILGMIARGLGDNERGLHYYCNALDMALEVHDLSGQATFTMNVANVLAELGALEEARELFERSMEISSKEGYLDLRMAALEGYVTVLEKQGDTRKALRLQKEWLALKDSLFEANHIKSLSELQIKYETERTERELAQERERGLRQRALQAGLLAAIALVVLLAVLIFSRQRARAKSELSATVNAEREQGLKAMVERTEVERKRIAAELHDGVGQQLSGLKFRLESAAAKDPQLKDLLVIADDAGKEIRGIAHQMMPRALGDLGLAPALNDMLQKSLTRPGMHHTFEQFGLDARLPQPVEVGVYRIAQELVNNIIKHAQATQVNVQLLKNKGHLVLIVEDDGVGIDRSRGNGLGIMSVHDRARLLHGTVEIEGGAERGTVATVRVPLQNGNLA